MKPTRSLLPALLAFACLPACAADDGWVTMFNGESLEGWKANEGTNWKVEDGAIVANGPRSHLYYMGREFKDFVLEAEVKTTPGSNSGIFIGAAYVNEGWPTEQGHEIQVNVTQSDPVKSGSLYNRVKIFEAPMKDGEWAKYRITVKGDTLRTEINGKVLYEYVQPPGVTQGPRLGKGYIALQAHDPNSVVHYRNLRIKATDGDKK